MTVGELIKELVKVRDPKRDVYFISSENQRFDISYAAPEDDDFVISDSLPEEDDETHNEEYQQPARQVIIDDDIPF